MYCKYIAKKVTGPVFVMLIAEILYFLFYLRRIGCSNKICTADILMLQSGILYRLIILVPLLLPMFYMVFEQQSGINYRIRYKSYVQFLLEQIKTSISMIFVLVLAELFFILGFSGYMELPFINWNSSESYFAYTYQMMMNCSFITVLLDYLGLQLLFIIGIWCLARIFWISKINYMFLFGGLLVIALLEIKFQVPFFFLATKLQVDLLIHPVKWLYKLLYGLIWGMIYVLFERIVKKR